MRDQEPKNKSRRRTGSPKKARSPVADEKRGQSRTETQKQKRPVKRVAAPFVSTELEKPERIAKFMARAGLCSRREAEAWITDGRVSVNGEKLNTPAFTVTGKDRVVVDGKPVAGRERTRLWLYNKPSGLVTTNKDPDGRPTVFAKLPSELPRVISVGRLDINTEGLLLLTNDGGLARVLELPTTGWLRRYRVRVHGEVDEAALADLANGIAVDGILYGAIEARLDQKQGANAWLTVSLREGKNREIKNVLGALNLAVTRLIRISFGPFQLGDLPTGTVREIRGRTLRDQLGEKLIAEANADFQAPIRTITHEVTTKNPISPDKKRTQKKAERPKKLQRGQVSQINLERLTTRPGEEQGRGRKKSGAAKQTGNRRKPFTSRNKTNRT